MAKTSSFRCSFSRVIIAPLDFVYAWWTDFREDDNKISGQKRRVRILERTRRRFVMSIRYKSGRRTMTAARIVSLMPPNAWRLDWVGDEADETGDYQLTPLGERKTRLTAAFKVRNKTPNAATKSEFVKSVNSVWDKYAAALERDYTRRNS